MNNIFERQFYEFDLFIDSDFKPPDHWDDMADDEYIKIVPLIQSSKEYTDVLTEFKKTGGALYTVVKVLYIIKFTDSCKYKGFNKVYTIYEIS